jgi:formate dehydrogenase (coenzyme F420) beta subunit
MIEYIDAIREAARKLLSEKKVDVFIGFRKGSVPMMNEPALISDASRVDELYYDSNCGINLANYITKRKDRIGILAKGCDSRNMVTHIVENQIKREQLHIVGVPCQGMIDRKKITAALNGKEIREVSEKDGQITVKGSGFEETLAKADYLQENCAICIHRNPVIHDELIAEPVEEQKVVDRYSDIREIEAMAPDDRWDYFAKLIEPCIRCYACRNACPQCYCPTCFVDESTPQWVGKSLDPTDTMTFHFLRAYHLAGRCTDCGACERACPVHIKVRKFTKKMEKDALEMFGWETGMTIDSRPPLDTFRPDDINDFIK